MLKIGEDNGLPCTYASGFVVLFQPDIKKGLDGCLYLLLQHKKGNYWDSPKGILEIGETPLSRAYLETKEESGLSVAHLSPLKRLRHTYSFDYGYNENMCRKKVTMSPALAPNKNAILSDEHSGLEWLLYDDAMERITFKNSRDCFRRIHDKILENPETILNAYRRLNP